MKIEWVDEFSISVKNDDKETFRIIIIILNDLEKRNKKRENLVNIYGYFTEKNARGQLQTYHER